MGNRWALAVVAAITAGTVLATPTATGAGQTERAGGRLSIEVVSSEPSRVTGGDALVDVVVPGGARQPRVRAGGRNVSDAFIEVEPGRWRGLVSDLGVGITWLRASVGSGFHWFWPGRTDSTVLVNRPIEGPLLSGSHVEPFYCETDAAGLGPALDEHCFAPTQVSYLYQTVGADWMPLDDPSASPADAAEVVVDGETLPFVVRLERGVINRGIYEIAALYDGLEPSPARAETGWNGKVVMTFGGGCNVGYHQGNATAGVLNAEALARGYAVASNSLLVNETNCHPVIAAESAAMTKERLVEVYGPVTHTIGLGGSGGAIMQYTITNAYPGILDGLLPVISYADSVTNAGPPDCLLLDRYLQSADGSTLTTAQARAIGGHQLYGVCSAWVLFFANRIDATTGCPAIIPPEDWFDPDTNPDGVSCALGDYLVNQVGVDPDTGRARPTYDNTGVQYGLGALESGAIDVEEFLDLNEQMGGFDQYGRMQEARSEGDPVGIRNMFRTGLVTTGTGGLAHTPTIDLRSYTDFSGFDHPVSPRQSFADIHTSFWSVAVHERLVRDGVDPTLHSRWIFQNSDGQRITEALDAMDEWLTAIAADGGHGGPAEKAARNRPDSAAPGCWPDPTGPKELDLDACYDGAFTFTGDLRTVAGAPITSDPGNCRLTAPDPSGYPVAFTAAEWDRLLAIFPSGVCDYSRPGIGQYPIKSTWMSYDCPLPLHWAVPAPGRPPGWLDLLCRP